MYSKRISELREPLDIDLQLLATEMDTSAKHLKFISTAILEDAFAIERFNLLIDDIERGAEGSEVMSFNDNLVLYEYLNEPVVIYTLLSEKCILFDSMITTKIEARMNSFAKAI